MQIYKENTCFCAVPQQQYKKLTTVRQNGQGMTIRLFKALLKYSSKIEESVIEAILLALAKVSKILTGQYIIVTIH